MHAGATLEPGVLTSITAASVRTEFSGKVHGAWQLITRSSHAALHSIKLFSSIAAFSGSGGQGSYAAGNGVLDSWAQSLQVSCLLTAPQDVLLSSVWLCLSLG